MFGDEDIEDEDGLRYYQRDAVNAAIKALQTSDSALLVLATGLGKTQIAGALARIWPGSILFLAHRDELIEQARKRLEQMTGEYIDVEQGMRSAYSARIVVGSVQSVMQKRRLDRLGETRFSLIIVDEAHHYISPSFKKPLDYFNAKVLGVTATPDRGDGVAMGQAFEVAPYKMDLADGIEAGYLVPLSCYRVHLDEINLERVGTSKGDLNTGQLDAVIVEAVEGITRKTVDLYPGKQAICFFPGVKSAEYACEKFNVLVPGSAIAISAETDKDERRKLVQDFKDGKYLYFCNCGIATEGFDAPDVSLIVIGRPTLSRSLYAQMVGRGTRTQAGTVDHIIGPDGAAARRAAIAGSGKPAGVILDFVGNGERHQLASPEDLLGGDYTPIEIKLAKKKAEEMPGTDVTGNLKAARSELAAMAMAMQARVKSRVVKFDPFGVVGVEAEPSKYDSISAESKRPDASLVNFLGRKGLKPKEIEVLDRRQAHKLKQVMVKRAAEGLASYKQLKVLRKYGISEVNVKFADASAAMSYLASTNWGKAMDVDAGHLSRILRVAVGG